MIFFASILSLFFSFLLLAKKNKSRADSLLFFWLIFISIHLFLFQVSVLGLYSKYPFLIGIDIAFPIFQALFLYFYVRLLTTPNAGFYKTDFLHLVPSLLAYIYMIPFFSKSDEDKIKYFQNIQINEDYFLAIFNLIFIISAIIYTYLTFRLIKSYRKYLGEHYSYSKRINVLWMKRLLTGMICIWIIVLIIKLLEVTNMYNNQNTGIYIISLSASLFVIFLGFFGIRQTTVFSDHTFPVKDENDMVATTKERYQRSGLKEEQSTEIKIRLLQLMNNEKRYLDNKLSLNSLAEEIKVNPNYLSQVINEQFSRNFYDFVNYFRVEEFKQKTADPKYKNYSILALAFDCGFNSKSAFYSVFKKFTGIAPSEFLKKHS